jgi:dihydroorotate dehydrogenase electron transfer subunit
VFVGGRKRVDILCEKEFRALGWDVRVTTEDGSHGEKGLVTQPLLAELRSSRGNEAQTNESEIRNRKSDNSQSLLTSAATFQTGVKMEARRKLFACGPTGMLKAVGKIAEECKVPAELSMDEHMCCGVGVCLTCVIPVKTGDGLRRAKPRTPSGAGGWEYQRTCTEGPVFDARQIAWEVVK